MVNFKSYNDFYGRKSKPKLSKKKISKNKRKKKKKRTAADNGICWKKS